MEVNNTITIEDLHFVVKKSPGYPHCPNCDLIRYLEPDCPAEYCGKYCKLIPEDCVFKIQW